MGVLEPVRDYIHGLVHPCARGEPLTAARHRAFIAARLAGGLTASALFPVQLALRGFPSPFEAIVFGWSLLPLIAVYYLTRTGHLENAYLFASLALSATVATVASLAGVGSSALIWLLAVPLEAALSASRRCLAGACVMGAGAAVLSLAAPELGIPPVNWQDAGTVPSLVAAMAYATLLGFAAVTQAQGSQALLATEQARHRLLAKHVSEVVLIHDRNGVIDFASAAAERLLGAEPGALRGDGLFERVHVADRPAYLKALSDAGRGRKVEAVVFRAQRLEPVQGVLAPGFVWLEMRCQPIGGTAAPTAAEAKQPVLCVLRDVSERKNLEQRLQAARAAAAQAAATHTRLLGTLGHELRTPLNAIIGFSDILLQEQALDLESSRRHAYARLINDSGLHLLALVDGLAEMWRLRRDDFPVSLESFALAPVISGCCELLALPAEQAGIKLNFQHPPTFLNIVADKRAIKQVVLNLLANAVKFTQDGGQITVSADQDRSFTTIVVEDTGVGIPQSDIRHLGDRGFQLPVGGARPRQGTGLGLCIVKGLIGLHGGTVEIESRLGQGTRVMVRLPNRAKLPSMPAADVEAPSRARLALIADRSTRKRA